MRTTRPTNIEIRAVRAVHIEVHTKYTLSLVCTLDSKYTANILSTFDSEDMNESGGCSRTRGTRTEVQGIQSPSTSMWSIAVWRLCCVKTLLCKAQLCLESHHFKVLWDSLVARNVVKGKNNFVVQTFGCIKALCENTCCVGILPWKYWMSKVKRACRKNMLWNNFSVQNVYTKVAQNGDKLCAKNNLNAMWHESAEQVVTPLGL